MAISTLMVRAAYLVTITAVISSHVNMSCSKDCCHVYTLCSKDCPHMNVSCSKDCSHVNISCSKDCSLVNISCYEDCPRVSISCSKSCYLENISCSKDCSRANTSCSECCFHESKRSSSQSPVKTPCFKDFSHVNNLCSKYCRCNLDSNRRPAAKCDIRGINSSTMAEICLPRDLYSLDLSSNGLKEIPIARFLHNIPNISFLSLANNSFSSTNFSFDGLSTLGKLQTLDLSHTNLWRLGEKPHQLLPHLERLVVKHSPLASPQNWFNLLNLPSIQQVTGVRWAASSCSQCNIFRGDNEVNNTPEQSTNCSRVKLSFTKKGSTVDRDHGKFCLWPFPTDNIKWYTVYHSPSWYLKPGFTLQCTCDLPTCTIKPPLDPIALLSRLLQRLFDCLYPLGSVALVLNLTVIFVISSTKTLRKSPTMILIANMAICDLLLAVYCMLSAAYNRFLNSDREVKAYSFKNDYPFDSFSNVNITLLKWPETKSKFHAVCPAITFVFSVTQFVSVMTSFYLTVERYLVIAYPLKRDVRMTRGISLICLCVTWSVAIAYNIDAILSYDVVRNRLTNYFVCSITGRAFQFEEWQAINQINISMAVFLSGFYILVLLCAIPLYIHMYIVVRRSSTRVGVKREGALARKLALLVFTNLLFSVLPISLMPVFGSRPVIHFGFIRDIFLKTYSSFKTYYIVFLWSPYVLLCLNCCLNPFLLAFRHHRFKKHFTQTICNVLEGFRNKQGAFHDQQPARGAKHKDISL